MTTPVLLHLYRFGTRMFEPLTLALLALRLRRGKEDPARIGERRGYASLARPSGKLVWMHGASVGETVSLLPLVDRFLARGFSVLMTSGTLTSARVMSQRLPKGAMHQYVPLDSAPYINRFFDHWKPDLVIVAESEIWPNVLSTAHARDIPLVQVNARMSERSFRRWQHVPGIISTLLGRIDLCLAQSDIDADRLKRLGAMRVMVTGNMKFDVPPPPADPEKLAQLRSALGKRPVWIAASTHDGEELLAIAAHKALQKKLPDLVTIIAPRHPERGEAIVAGAVREGLRTARRSTGDKLDHRVDLYVADTIGELGLFYAAVPVAFLGGSLVRHGGQNPIEPAKLGSALLHGPHVRNFVDIFAAFDQAGGAAEVKDAASLSDALDTLLCTPSKAKAMGKKAKATAASLGGAVERAMQALEPYILHIALTSASDPRP